MVGKKFFACKRKSTNRSYKYYSLLSLYTILFLFLITGTISENKERILTGETSEIHLIIEGTGAEQQIIFDGYTGSSPSECLVEGNTVTCSKTCNIGSAGTDYNVVLKFPSGMASCFQMFKDINKIKEIDFSNFDFSSVNNIGYMLEGCTSLTSVNFGTNILHFTSIGGIFKGCSNLISADLSKFDISGVKTLEKLFDGCTNLESVNFGNIDTSTVESMFALFSGCSKLSSMDFSIFDFTNVVNIDWMLAGTKALKNVTFGDIHTPNLVNMATAFQDSGLTSLDLSKFDLSHVNNMYGTFNGCGDLLYINFGNNTTPVLTNMGVTFQGCKKLKSIDLSNFDFSKVDIMEFCFNDCLELENINFGDITTSSLKNTKGLFQNCQQLESMDVSDFDFSKVTTMQWMFKNCKKLENVNFGNIDTSSLVDMNELFNGCTNLISADLSKFDTSKVTMMEWMFSQCTNLVNVTFGNIDTSSLISMKEIFKECTNLKEVDLSNFNFTKVKDMNLLFYSCSNLESVNFGNSETSSLENMAKLFQGCSKLESIDLSHFNTSKVKDISSLFNGCSRLDEIDISNFDFSEVTNMEWMFNDCSNVKNINFGSTITSSLKAMNTLFQRCSNLESIDLSNFDTSKVTNMESMFNGCSSLRYLNLSNFDTTEVKNIKDMFSGGNKLIYLNLYNFQVNSSVEFINMFWSLSPNVIYCINDQSTKDLILDSGKIAFCSDECFNMNNTKIDINGEKCVDSCENAGENKYDYKNRCDNKCPSGTVLKDFICLDKNCNGEEFLENNIECGDDKPLGFYLDSSDNVYKKCYETCKSCEEGGNTSNHNCNECNAGYRFINDFENDKNCYENCSHYYYLEGSTTYKCTLDANCPSPYNILIQQKGKCIDQCQNDNIYKYPYHDTCSETLIIETTINNVIETTINIIETTEKNIIETTEKNIIETTEKNIVETTERNIVETTVNNIIETTNNGDKISVTTNILEQIVETTNKENIISEYITTEKQSSSSNGALYQCLNDDPLIDKCSLKDIYNNDEIYDLLMNDILSSYSENDKSIVIEGEDDTIFQVTSAKNEMELLKNNNISDDYNLSIIDFTECETLLKKKYNINENDSLIFIKQEKSSGKASEKSIQYECFEPYNKTKLNMSICSEVSINIYVPIVLSEETKKMADQMKELGYNMFDLNDKFYNDICTPYKSSGDSDVLLSDRVDYIYNNDDAQCQGNCKFSDYFLGSRFINCSCNVDTEDKIETEKIDKFETKSLYQMFYFVLKYSNYEIFKCYNLVFHKNSITKNWGSIIILILFILYLICLIMHIFNGLAPLRTSTKAIIEEIEKTNANKFNLFFPPKKRKSALKNIEKKNKDSTKKLSIFDPENNKKNSDSKLVKKQSTNSIAVFDKKKARKSSKAQLINVEKERSNSKQHTSSTGIIINPDNSEKIKKTKKKSKDVQSELNLKEKKEEDNHNKILDDFELNDLSYEEAIIYDQRTFFQVYLSLLRREHRILFTFFVCHDYNLIFIKLSRFIFLLATDIAMNVFFFSDVTMHKTFLNYGKYNFLQQIPQIIYSTIVSQMIEVFLCFLSLTDKHIYQIKSLEINSKYKKVIIEVFKCIKIKLLFYFIFTFIFFGFYWYAVAAFCAVYENSQSAFIKDSFISFLLSLAYPFVLYTFPSAFRIFALKCKNQAWLYKLSDVIPIF